MTDVQELNEPLQGQGDGQGKSDAGEDSIQARPWPRYWARMIDLTIFTMGLMFAFSIGSAILSPPLFQALFESDSKSGSNILGWIFIPFGMILDAAVYSAFGNTPGKWLLGLRVTTATGARLGFWTALQRNFGVYWKGLGTGFPLVTLFTLSHSYNVAKAGNALAWDVKTGSRTRGNSPGYRTWLGALIYGGIWFGLIAMGQVAGSSSGGSSASAPAARKATLKETLEITAREVTSASPKMVDDDTRMDGGTAGPGDRFTYLYTLVNLDGTQVTVNEEVRKQMLANIWKEYCGAGALKEFRDLKVEVRFSYRDKAGVPFTELSVAPDDCR